jgi:ParB family chromosome partitioning protein
MQALNTDKTELSKLLSVARSVPGDIIEAIGAAPNTGRRKWMDLAEKLADTKLLSIARKEMQSSKLEGLESDDRFKLIVTRVSARPNKATAIAEWKTKDGRVEAKIKDTGKAYMLSLKANGAEGFGTYLSGRLDELYANWQANETKE